MDKRLLQTALVVALAACTLFFGCIGVLACIPETAELEAVEPISASASKLMADEGYRIDVVGRVKNTTDKPLIVDCMEVLLTDAQEEKEMLLTTESLTILPKNMVDVDISVEADDAFQTVKQVNVVVSGDSFALKNTQDMSLATALIPLVLTAIFAFFLVRACKVLYYMVQEARADEADRAAVADNRETKNKI